MGQSRPSPPSAAVGTLSKELPIRVINCSASGCLVEASSRVDVGTIASLRLKWSNQELAEDVRVVRCQALEGAGRRHHVGVEFLRTVPLDERSLRGAIWLGTLNVLPEGGD
jgi:PilZ domain